MKKNLVYAMMSAIALTSAVSFTGCASDDSASVDTNPTYDGTSVRTDFAFNITKASQETRMSAVNTQEDGTFQGMKRMYLLPFSAEPAADVNTNTNIYSLGSLANTEIVKDGASKKIYALTLPIGTNNFLFYGTSAKTGTNFEVGKVSSNFWPSDTEIGSNAAMSTNDISFGLTPIATGLGSDATNIAAYLTTIANATDWSGTVTQAATNGNYRALADLYTQFTTVNSGEARSGSAESVVRMVLDLYKSAKKINQESSIDAIKTIAGAICTAIKAKDSSVKVEITDTDAEPNNWTAKAAGFNAAFPSNLNLPMGSALLQFSSTGFSYKNSTSSPAPAIREIGVDYTQIDYPAELIYFDNSPLRATTAYKTANDFPSTAATWDVTDASTSANGFTADWTETSVSAATRAVAMTNNVNYGVALFETTVKLAQEALTDNMATILGGSAADQTDIDGTKFKVTGILIGGQPNQVGWNMINGGSGFSNVIYDKDVQFPQTATEGKILTTSASSKNYTAVFDNYTTASEQTPVNFALEIVNGDQDFYGKHNMIPAGSTFYLVGQIILTKSNENWSGENSVKANRPATYRITNEGTKRVFVQDYKTTANVTITKDALKNAYSTIPDLRSTEVVFGLSVETKWQSGLTFDIEMK